MIDVFGYFTIPIWLLVLVAMHLVIMGAVAQLAKGQRLRLYATFKPEPLFHVMANQGFGHEASPLENGEWMVIFTPVEGK